MVKIKAVLFDLDRTLINSGPAHDEIINPRVSREFGFKEPVRFKGRPIYPMLKAHGFSLERIRAYTDRIEQLEFECCVRVFPKTNELLRGLRQRGITTAVATNRPTTKRYFEALRHFGLKIENIDWFLNADFYPPEITTSDNHLSAAVPKPYKHFFDPLMPHLSALPDFPKSILMVGDHLFDWRAARKNNFDFIPVLSGAYPEPRSWLKASCDGPFIRDVGVLYKWWFC